MALTSPFPPKGKLETQHQDAILPGAKLPIQIRVMPEEDIQPREIRVELVGEETYFVKVRHKDSYHYQSMTNTFAKIVQTVAEQPALFNGVEQKWNSVIELPADAPATCRGKLVNIHWTLKAVLDVPKRGDLSQEKSLNVICPSAQAGDAAITPVEMSYKEVTLVLKAPKYASTGSTLKGRLDLQVKDKLSMRSIRVELVRAEKAGSRHEDKVISTSQIAGIATFNQNESPHFEFPLDIPADAPPTAICKNSSLIWKVKAVIDRKMTTDFNVEQEVVVYNAPKATVK